MTTRVRTAAAADLVLILVFAIIGTMSHDESVLKAPLVALPFWVGAAAGWAVIRSRSGRFPIGVGTGVTVWICAVAIGMILRAVTGAGVELSFVIVTAIVLGLFLLGWRLAEQKFTFLPREQEALR
ncbi:DUF3054 domain-containing protein [Dermacoccaceae bacterium W4C1]